MTATKALKLMKKTMKYSYRILELVENQVRNDENSLTQSDLHGAIEALVMNILHDRG